MNGEAAPEQETRDRAARDLRRQAVSLSRSEFEMNRVHHAMSQIEPAKVKALLMEIADFLSPGTTGWQVRLISVDSIFASYLSCLSKLGDLTCATTFPRTWNPKK